jgi:transposase
LFSINFTIFKVLKDKEMHLKLTQEQIAEIRHLHSQCRIKKIADKFKALLLLDKGFSCVEVGEILLLDDDTIRKYRNQYLSQGAESLLSDNNKGSRPYLSAEQLDMLDKHLQENVYSDSKGIREWILQNFNVKYTTSGILALLKRMGFVYKKPVLTPCKANVEKQKEFVEGYRELKNNLSEKDQIYFVDGVHPQHNSIADYGWIKRGETKCLKTNNGRQRVNINGAINLETKQVVYVEDEQINAQTMIALLLKILKTQKEGKIHIILDNAKYYHAKIVKEFLKDNPRIQLHFLPPYSPNLNIIERLWHILKKEVAYNKFHARFCDFKKAVLNFFEEEIWRGHKLKNMLTDNFHIVKPHFSDSYL